ncbi:MAG: ATP-binding protein [Anaerovibrio sp.]
MLERKIEQTLIDWKNTPGRLPMVIKGCRQCGKTASVLHFAKKYYPHAVYLNFFESPAYNTIFQGDLNVDFLTMMITAHLGSKAVFEPGRTIIILDEIQNCPEAHTALKFFHLDGRYDVISTSSLLGVKGYGQMPKSIPVGYETTVTMFPMDFEEFLWANGIDKGIITLLKNQLASEAAIPEALHQRLRQLLLQYTVVGGMPAIVQNFVLNHNMGTVLAMQRDIVHSYEDDMVKYAPNKDKIRIRKCFLSIPNQLAKENKKFQYSLVEKRGSAAKFESSLERIADADIINRCTNLHTPELPLAGNADENIFKIYMADIGLFISMLEDGTQSDIMTGNLLGYKGAIFENLIADFLGKQGMKLYYFRKDSGLEIDFVIRYHGQATLMEVKATNGNTKSTKAVLAKPDKYHVTHALKLGDFNISRNGAILNLPLYMGAFLNQP